MTSGMAGGHVDANLTAGKTRGRPKGESAHGGHARPVGGDAGDFERARLLELVARSLTETGGRVTVAVVRAPLAALRIRLGQGRSTIMPS